MHPLAMTACPCCELVQLSRFPPGEVVRPRVPWLRYTEPEAHLDDLAERLRIRGTAIGLGPFDRPLLDRLAKYGADVDVVRWPDMEPRRPDGGFPYLETYQSYLCDSPLGAVARERGKADLVALRYLLEHSHDPLASLRAMRQLLRDGGRVIVEVPDSSKFLHRRDYSFIWEEHICYFAESTLRRLAARAGYDVVDFYRYEGPMEDALVAVLQPSPNAVNEFAPQPHAVAVFDGYRDAFASVRGDYQQKLAAYAASGSRVAMFGIGHQAIMFMNALGLQSRISMLVDDDPAKQGYFAPGSTTPIVGSAQLDADPSVDVCLLAVGPRAVQAIRGKLTAFARRGGRTFSIFSGIGEATLLDAS